MLVPCVLGLDGSESENPETDEAAETAALLLLKDMVQGWRKGSLCCEVRGVGKLMLSDLLSVGYLWAQGSFNCGSQYTCVCAGFGSFTISLTHLNIGVDNASISCIHNTYELRALVAIPSGLSSTEFVDNLVFPSLSTLSLWTPPSSQVSYGTTAKQTPPSRLNEGIQDAFKFIRRLSSDSDWRGSRYESGRRTHN